jgi:Ser/Thr protein kinase RdoA (MazF antagonist)
MTADPRPSVDHAAVLAEFGIRRSTMAHEPSLVSAVARVVTEDGRTWYLKEHPADDTAPVRFADAVAERLGVHGIRAPRLRRAVTGEPFARCGGRLFTLAPAIVGRPLHRDELRDSARARRVARFVAEVHAALASLPALPVPPRPSLWHDRDHDARADAAHRRLLGLPPSRDRDALLRAATLVQQEPRMRRTLVAAAPVLQGLVHGDLWPGNVLVEPPGREGVCGGGGGGGPGRPGEEALAVLDLESACRAPLLLDVAHFVDLAFRVPGDTGRLDVGHATAFARAYAIAGGLAPQTLAYLPDLLLAARGCSLLWTVERHLDIGANPLDPLVAADVARVEHVLSIRDRWADELSTDVAPADMSN